MIILTNNLNMNEQLSLMSESEAEVFYERMKKEVYRKYYSSSNTPKPKIVK